MGKLFVIDGTDGSGKQTQLKKLEDKYALSQDPNASDEEKIFDREKIMKEAEKEQR